MNEWMNEWIDKYMNKWVNKWMNKWMDEWVVENISQVTTIFEKDEIWWNLSRDNERVSTGI